MAKIFLVSQKLPAEFQLVDDNVVPGIPYKRHYKRQRRLRIPRQKFPLHTPDDGQLKRRSTWINVTQFTVKCYASHPEITHRRASSESRMFFLSHPRLLHDMHKRGELPGPRPYGVTAMVEQTWKVIDAQGNYRHTSPKTQDIDNYRLCIKEASVRNVSTDSHISARKRYWKPNHRCVDDELTCLVTVPMGEFLDTPPDIKLSRSCFTIVSACRLIFWVAVTRSPGEGRGHRRKFHLCAGACADVNSKHDSRCSACTISARMPFGNVVQGHSGLLLKFERLPGIYKGKIVFMVPNET